MENADNHDFVGLNQIEHPVRESANYRAPQLKIHSRIRFRRPPYPFESSLNTHEEIGAKAAPFLLIPLMRLLDVEGRIGANSKPHGAPCSRALSCSQVTPSDGEAW
jgi:hypothetical protein